ncbi:MAG: hypothetical protein HND47_05425 [Chloroflexi bacterium]|nr:hypothetical protein [Chloroflexota bacterium]
MSTLSQFTSKGTGQNWVKWLIATLVPAAIAFLASPSGPFGSFWRPSTDVPPPTNAQLPLFLLLNVAEVLAFGIGVSFLIFGYPTVRRVLPRAKGLAFVAYLSIAWLLVNWWPHDSLHIANGTDIGGLLAIEYAFHVTLIVAGVILVYFFLALARQQSLPPR